MTGELRVDTAALSAGGQGLQSAANNIPAPPAPFTAGGGDALSTILNSRTQAIEAPLIEGLPTTKQEALRTAENVVNAASTYERTDQEIADRIRRQLDGLEAPSDTPGGGGSGAGAPSATGAGAPGAGGGAPGAVDGVGGGAAQAAAPAAGGAQQAGQLQQMMGMPMQMAQQVGQMPMQMAGMAGSLPQSVMQGVQQATQMAGGMGDKNGEPPNDPDGTDVARPDETKPAAPQGAAPGPDHSERAPEPTPRHSADQTSPHFGATPPSDAVPKDSAPQTSTPRHAAPDPEIVL